MAAASCNNNGVVKQKNNSRGLQAFAACANALYPLGLLLPPELQTFFSKHPIYEPWPILPSLALQSVNINLSYILIQGIFLKRRIRFLISISPLPCVFY